MNKPEHELERRVAHDPEAFSLLYEENYSRVFNYVLYSTCDVEMALDLTSETFFKAFRALPRYRYRGVPFLAWLLKIASNELAMFHRKNRAGREISSSPESLGVREEVVEEEVRSAREEIEACDALIDLSPLLRKLSLKYREVVFLRFFEDMSIGDISQALGRSPGTVKSQLHRGLGILRAGMQPETALEHCIKAREGKTTEVLEEGL